MGDQLNVLEMLVCSWFTYALSNSGHAANAGYSPRRVQLRRGYHFFLLRKPGKLSRKHTVLLPCPRLRSCRGPADQAAKRSSLLRAQRSVFPNAKLSNGSHRAESKLHATPTRLIGCESETASWLKWESTRVATIQAAQSASAQQEARGASHLTEGFGSEGPECWVLSCCNTHLRQVSTGS